jgi:hypothetical protein
MPSTRPLGDREFESLSLYRRVRCEPDFLDQGCARAARFARTSVKDVARRLRERIADHTIPAVRGYASGTLPAISEFLA